ncbi:hypothetical protein K432DRAFT_302984 [Lepidopterella palustris CBS 459.81]|uniref:RBR-type E3 ubiquitin transferase n=1 Tax=Lepidopterella palustris CBS 459.81 TaxID=1314670 RepID=A0A8E2E6B1_9PEZI|nr:hypothetical protein K432DRAFT_302984 [Lepidopterella palustris CBS 459.81]
MQQEEEDQIRREMSRPRTRDCAVCAKTVAIPEFPALMNCEHEPQVCADCFKDWIASELDSKGWKDMKCPEAGCKVLLTHADVQEYAASEVYTKFDGLSAREALNDDPNFKWCRGPKCKSGQIHENGVDGNIFRCVACGFRVCVVHEDTWHEGETCEEYDYRKSGKKEKDQKAQEAASVAVISQMTKKCPGKNCTYNIEKNDGCDHMTCLKCRHEFCWLCLAPYGPIRKKGNGAHKTSCKYHSNNIT